MSICRNSYLVFAGIRRNLSFFMLQKEPIVCLILFSPKLNLKNNIIHTSAYGESAVIFRPGCNGTCNSENCPIIIRNYFEFIMSFIFRKLRFHLCHLYE